METWNAIAWRPTCCSDDQMAPSVSPTQLVLGCMNASNLSVAPRVLSKLNGSSFPWLDSWRKDGVGEQAEI